MANKYKGKPNLFYNDMLEAAEYVRELEKENKTPQSNLNDVVYAIGCQFSENGSTTEQDLFLDEIKKIDRPE